MILTHGANSIKRGGGNTVNIGGKEYPYIEMDGKLWIAKNLDFVWAGLTVGDTGSPTTPAANYYDNDESTYGWNGKQCGLLYNFAAYKSLRDNNILPDGWRVVNRNDWDSLMTFLGGSSGSAKKLKALDNSVGGTWPTSWNGTDIYGFDVLPSGYSLSGSNFLDIGVYFYMWVEYPNYNDKRFQRFSSGDDPFGTYNGNWGYSIRLVKDAT